MPRYRLLTPHVIDGAIRDPGYEVELHCEPSLEMEPLDAGGREALAKFREKLGALQPVDANQGDTLRYRLWTAALLREALQRKEASNHGQIPIAHAAAPPGRGNPPRRE
jgi:hypothetical protein